MPYLLFTCQIGLAAVLIFAATGKILRSEQFLAALRLSHLPGTLVVPIAVLTPALEMCLTIGLVLSTPRSLPLIMAATAGILGVFTAWMVVVFARGMQLTCGCFGTGDAKVGPHTIVRNVALIAIALGGLHLALHTRSVLPAPSPWMGVAVLTLSLCLMLLQAFRHGRVSLVFSESEMALLQVQARTGEGLDR